MQAFCHAGERLVIACGMIAWWQRVILQELELIHFRFPHCHRENDSPIQSTVVMPSATMIETSGWSVLAALRGLGELAIFTREVIRGTFSGKVSLRELVYQIYFIGVKSQSVVFITGAFTGMVLCAQTYFQFHKVRMDTATLAVVSVSMCSELGPVLTALMIAGRVGAALAAELGTMKVTEQIDALRTLATHPVDYLVVPRVIATTLATPVLTAAAIALGIGAAWLLGVTFLGIDATYSWSNMLRYTVPGHVATGIIKAIFYGAIISLISCYKGMSCGEGAEGVGRATTEAVVYSSITVLISNFFLTMFLNHLLQSG
jgi:phospholipid/cholesterol/gamma-HCH transport system permease protein